jgi:hypothetical protein
MTREKLSLKSIHELRTLGREIGVKSPTSCNKDKLIDRIIAVDTGRVKPFFTQKGRPPYKSKGKGERKSLSVKEIEQIDKILENAKQEIIRLLVK